MNLSSELKELIDAMIGQKASDLILTEGQPALIRVSGDLRPVNDRRLSSEAIEKLAFELIDEEKQKAFRRELEVDASFGLEDAARFRINVFRQRNATGLVMRMLTDAIPSIEDLGVPAVVKNWLGQPHGIIITTGPTGSGKSTTQAAMIGYLNQSKYHHIITIEDPIEYTHRHGTCTIEQREVGRDTLSFSKALKSVFRQTPDVIMIGEVRDRETVETALQLAETGHLVLATLHTGDAMQAISRVIDMFPPEQHQQVRVQLSLTLIGVLVQQLVPSLEGGRLLAAEVLHATSSVRHLIRKNELQHLYSVLQTGSEESMLTMNNCLLNLFRAGRISMEQALLFTTRQKELEEMIARDTGSRVFGKQKIPAGKA